MSRHVKRMVQVSLLTVGTLLLLDGCAQDNQPTEQIESAIINMAAPGLLASGQSTIEGRYVYATPDEGEISFSLGLGFAAPGEMAIIEPSMVNGDASVRFKYSKKNNTVDVFASFRGLPFRPTFTKGYDNSTEFNKQFVQVKDAHWQLWLAGSVFGRQHETVYYDASTFKFLGTRYDFQPLGPRPQPAPGTYFSFPAPVVQMVCSPMFEGNEEGNAELHFKLQYDHIADFVGSPGTMATALPFDLCEVDHYDFYWTNTRLPEEKFMTWDTFLQSIWNGENIVVSMSAEPFPKPPEITFRDNTFIAWTNYYPMLVPRGFNLDFRSGGRVEETVAGSRQIARWPASRRHLCGGGH